MNELKIKEKYLEKGMNTLLTIAKITRINDVESNEFNCNEIKIISDKNELIKTVTDSVSIIREEKSRQIISIKEKKVVIIPVSMDGRTRNYNVKEHGFTIEEIVTKVNRNSGLNELKVNKIRDYKPIIESFDQVYFITNTVRDLYNTEEKQRYYTIYLPAYMTEEISSNFGDLESNAKVPYSIRGEDSEDFTEDEYYVEHECFREEFEEDEELL